jgi:hypothetical protein
MKFSFATVGVVGLLMAGSANAAVVYDTLTGQTAATSKLLLVQQNHAPMGNTFTAAFTETVSSVSVQLSDASATSSTHVGDSGSVLVYLVSNTGSLPSATGVILSNPILLGSILDSALLGGGIANNETLATNVTIAPGSYWLMLTSGSDPNNGNGNPVASTAGWNEIVAATALNTIGMPSTNYSAYTNTTNTGYIDATNGDVFMAQVQTPEPASMAILGSGLIGLGLSRRRRRSQKLVNNTTAV